IRLSRISQTVGERRAELLADGYLGDERRAVAVAGGIHRCEAIVRNPVPAPDHVLTLPPDIPGESEPRREIQMIRLPTGPDQVRLAVGDLLGEIGAGTVHEVPEPIGTVREGTEVLVAQPDVDRKIALRLPIVLNEKACLPDTHGGIGRGGDAGYRIHGARHL